MAVERVLIISTNASKVMGGESILPVHYFERLNHEGVEAHLLTHARNRGELTNTFSDWLDRLHFVEDTVFHRLIWYFGKNLPSPVNDNTLVQILKLTTQVSQRRAARNLVEGLGFQIVHEPAPVSPLSPSFLFDIGCPVIIGPMNGNMSYPEGFEYIESFLEKWTTKLARSAAPVVNRLVPGKRKAALLLAANTRTVEALARISTSRVKELVENGVDESLWSGRAASTDRGSSSDRQTVFCFIGRLIQLKCVDVLIEAFAAAELDQSRLVVIGDGPERSKLESLARKYSSKDIEFTGFLSQEECAAKLAVMDVLVLPSVHECGGAVVLEAMCSGLPVVAAKWGGPADYLDDDTGILVEPYSREVLLRGIASALERLHRSRDLRMTLGRRARNVVLTKYTWRANIQRIRDAYESVTSSQPRGSV